MEFFSTKICLLNHRKLDKMQDGSSEEAKKKSYSIERKYFCKIWEI